MDGNKSWTHRSVNRSFLYKTTMAMSVLRIEVSLSIRLPNASQSPYFCPRTLYLDHRPSSGVLLDPSGNLVRQQRLLIIRSKHSHTNSPVMFLRLSESENSVAFSPQ